jgi:L-ascorbate metabolism protein UlaG (beta-lactamase superfamily)
MVRCSTLVIEIGGVRFLTDPWFGMHMRGLPCYRRPGMRPSEVPPLDALLVSHLHPDHFDARAIRELAPRAPVGLFPPGALAAIRDPDPSWRELAPWTSTVVGGITVHAVPGPHTLPGPEEVNFVLLPPGGGPVFFGGDARFDRDVLTETARAFAPFRLALLPVGGTRILGKRTVMGPSDALEAADILRAATVIPIHEGGIWMSVPPLSLHPGRAEALAASFEARGEPGRVVVLAEGETWEAGGDG